MQFVLILSGIILLSVLTAVGQTRTDIAARFGLPKSEVFMLPHNVRLTATYDADGRVCVFRIETPEHSDRGAPSLTDARFWIDSAHVSRLIADLVPDNTRHGMLQSQVVGLRVGEHMRVELDDTVQITRIQRSRPLLLTAEMPVADRLVKIVFRRPECHQ